MRIKKFTAFTAAKALQQVRKELGADAVVLHLEEKLDKKTKKQFVEVTAAADEEFNNERKLWDTGNNSLDKRNRSKDNINIYLDDPVSDNYHPYDTASQKSYRSTAEPEKSPQSFTELEEVKQQLQMVTQLLQYSQTPNLPPAFTDVYIQMIQKGVEPKIAAQLLQDIENRISQDAQNSRSFVRSEAVRSLQSFISNSTVAPFTKKEVKPEILVLIGPTGVGKTTCIAKLSALDTIYKKRSVGLISIDTYRIAAIEQLRTYANITRIPFQVAYSPNDLKNAVKRFSECDVIYIDTPGRSPKNSQALKEMAQYFRKLHKIPSINFQLVLSLACKTEDLAETIKGFSIFPIEQMLLTKLDETNTFGTILTLLQLTKKTISYFSNGQNVPDDIMKPSTETIAKMIMGEKIL